MSLLLRLKNLMNPCWMQLPISFKKKKKKKIIIVQRVLNVAYIQQKLIPHECWCLPCQAVARKWDVSPRTAQDPHYEMLLYSIQVLLLCWVKCHSPSRSHNLKTHFITQHYAANAGKTTQLNCACRIVRVTGWLYWPGQKRLLRSRMMALNEGLNVGS